MINLLKIDFYKMFKAKSFYIIAAIFVALSTLTVVATSWLYASLYKEFQANPDIDMLSLGIDSSSIPGAFSIITANINSILIFAAIFLVLFVCSEFSCGTIKNIASKGYAREKIYLSKFICGISCLIIYSVLYVAASLIASYIVVKNTVPNYFVIPPQFWGVIALALFLLIAYLSLVLMIASLIRGSGASIGLFLGINMVLPLLLPKLDELLKNVFKIDFQIRNYSLSSCLGKIVEQDLNTAFANDEIIRFLCVGAGFLIVTLFVGLFCFRKRDL